jgi:hypothetical protein
MKNISMIEVPGTSVVAKDSGVEAQFTRMLAPKTAPVFEAEPSAGQPVFSEVVAVTYRNEKGMPVHGGLFGVSTDGVMSLALKDLEGNVDTSKDPAHVAFGLIMMRGPLVFRQNGADQTMALHIIDLTEGRLDEALHASTPVREDVKSAYLNEVLPVANVTQPEFC